MRDGGMMGAGLCAEILVCHATPASSEADDETRRMVSGCECL